MEEIINDILEAEKKAVEIKQMAQEKAAFISENAEACADELFARTEAECKIMREKSVKAAEAEAEKRYAESIEKSEAQAKAYAEKTMEKSGKFVKDAVRRIVTGGC